MGELEAVSMEELPCDFIFFIAFAASIDCVAQDGGSEMFQMDSDLVRPSGFGPDKG